MVELWVNEYFGKLNSVLLSEAFNDLVEESIEYELLGLNYILTSKIVDVCLIADSFTESLRETAECLVG